MWYFIAGAAIVAIAAVLFYKFHTRISAVEAAISTGISAARAATIGTARPTSGPVP